MDARVVSTAQQPNFAWLVRLRWGAILSQALTVVVVQQGLGLALAWPELTGIISLTALSNLACEWWRRRRGPASDGVIATIMALDFALLTALLRAAGGPSNPFSVLYLVHVALSAAILRPAFAWALACLSTALYGLLFLLPVRHDAVLHAMGMHHAASGGMGLHYQGMWVAFAIAAFVIVYFVTRIAGDLSREREGAAEARARAARSEKLASLATLAAGAAHELGSPLSTIAVAARELERGLTQGKLHEDALLDVQAVRDEVERCRGILSQLAADAGEQMGEAVESLSCEQLVQQTLEGLTERARVSVHLDAGLPELEVPRRALAQALRALLKNALDASGEGVSLRVFERAGLVCAEVTDRGVGMSADVRARVGEPFFTTKPPGRGMGLGVFLSRAVLERLGGELRHEPRAGGGTSALASFRARLSAQGGSAKVGRTS